MVVWVRGGRWDGGANRAKQVQGEKEKVGRAESSFRDARGACLACRMVPKRTKSAFVGSRRRRWPERERGRFLWSQKLRAWFGSIAIASDSQHSRWQASTSRGWNSQSRAKCSLWPPSPLAILSPPLSTWLSTLASTLAVAATLRRALVRIFKSVDRITVARFAASETTLLLASAHPPICVHTLIATSTLGDSITA